jgi:hypothetical protein
MAALSIVPQQLYPIYQYNYIHIPTFTVPTARLKRFNYKNKMATPNDEIPITTSGIFVSTESANVSHNPTTKFADDTEGATATIPLETSMSTSLYSNAIVPSSQTIIDYLRRPATLGGGVFQASDITFLY